jgi:hypothetical protein
VRDGVPAACHPILLVVSRTQPFLRTPHQRTVKWRQTQSRAWATRVAPVDGIRFSTQPSFSVASAGEHLGPQLNATRTFDRGACVKNCRSSDTGRSKERFLTVLARANVLPKATADQRQPSEQAKSLTNTNRRDEPSGQAVGRENRRAASSCIGNDTLRSTHQGHFVRCNSWYNGCYRQCSDLCGVRAWNRKSQSNYCSGRNT